jgi:hypothetical protein
MEQKQIRRLPIMSRDKGAGRDRRFSGSGSKGGRNDGRTDDSGDFLLEITEPVLTGPKRISSTPLPRITALEG